MEEVINQEKNKSNNEEFKSLLSQDLDKRKFTEGTVVLATISEIGDKFVFCDVGLKSEGAISTEEFKLTRELDDLSVGSKIEVYLEKIENRDGDIVVSREKARRAKSWKKMEKNFEEKKPIEASIISKIKGGYICDYDSVLAFLPNSQVDVRPLKNIDHLMKSKQTFEIVKVDKRRGNIVLSRRAIIEKIKNEDKEKHMKDLKEGMILKGCVCKSLQSWGAFFSYESLDLLVHINELSWSRVTTPADLLQIGQTCDVYLYKIEGSRISGSLKRLQPDPFVAAAKKYKPGMIVENCTVHQLRDYGAFINIEPNLTGLVHNSCLDHLNPNIHPSKVLSVSQKIKVKILSLDVEERKLSLSYKDCFPSPWIAFKEKYKEGSIVTCKVRQKNDYGIFLHIEDTTIVGMLHISNLEWDTKKGEERLSKIFKNDVIKCKIYSIDNEKMKTQLTLKHMEPDPFEIAFGNKKISDIITVTVQSTSPNGIYVLAGKQNFSVLIKKNQLAKDIQNQRQTRFAKGDKIDSMIIDLDKTNKRKVVLSIKALEEKQSAANIKKYGAADSGGILADVFDFTKVKTKKPKD